MGPISLLNVPSRNFAPDFAMSSLFETMIRLPMISLWLMNQSEAIDYVGWHKQSLDD